ncbi:precorrin-2 dehydrogenase/sirohydrochlorin ferrochelatase [Halanaerobium saccharolyticum]|uniref:precorrin-2 dehydrogenase n=1 Tax=Halanaerobium saccharolyticum TaxID=43595 RepID=A0A4R6LVR9_9FIRM|nr:bifunctional precorrin-2 dehydrogenase/sirohydrochlorin ferrochelatase [Halanaerobium saccharolyticum]TDO92185.1 precorrin-2 dehydrogenase/sirohydrochlorin ferrochelatase [Halanaerobium saccharolyticum]
MKFYPINLNLKDKNVLIVGAGKVALRKFKRLLPTGARIKIVAPEFNQGFSSYSNQESEEYILLERKFIEEDLIGQFLVFAATDNSSLNERIALLARGKNILINIIDNAELSDFTVPAVVNRGELLLTVSSGSNLPALSKNIRKKLESDFGLEYRLLLDIMSEKRQEIIENIEDDKLRKTIFSEIASDVFMSKIKDIIADHNPEILANSNYQFDSTEYLAVKKDIKAAVSQLIEKMKSQK